MEDLKRTHEAALKAYKSRDLVGYLASFHDDITIFYTGIPPLYGKDSFRDQTESAWEMSESFEMNWYNITYRVFGDTGIVLCKLTAIFRLKNGQELRYNDRASITYVRQDGKWRVVLIHSSPLQQ